MNADWISFFIPSSVAQTRRRALLSFAQEEHYQAEQKLHHTPTKVDVLAEGLADHFGGGGQTRADQDDSVEREDEAEGKSEVEVH